MPKLKSQVVKVLPERIDEATPYAVLYIRASDNFDAIALHSLRRLQRLG